MYIGMYMGMYTEVQPVSFGTPPCNPCPPVIVTFPHPAISATVAGTLETPQNVEFFRLYTN
jgi:hypothetical protein